MSEVTCTERQLSTPASHRGQRVGGHMSEVTCERSHVGGHISEGQACWVAGVFSSRVLVYLYVASLSYRVFSLCTCPLVCWFSELQGLLLMYLSTCMLLP